jgi:flagellar hook protein FlgE
MNVMFNDQGRSLVLQPNQGVWVSYKDSTAQRTIGAGAFAFSFTLNGTVINGTTPGVSATDNASYIAQQINAKTAQTGVVAVGAGTTLSMLNDNSRESNLNATKNIVITATDANSNTLGIGDTGAGDINATTAFQYQYATNAVDTASLNAPALNTPTTFRTTEQLRLAVETHARAVAGFDPNGADNIAGNADDNYAAGITVVMNARGQFEIKNASDGDANQEDLRLQVTAFTDSASNITKNTRFTEPMQSASGTLIEGSTAIRLSQGFNAATHSASIDIYDSLGSKHTLRMDYRKTAVDNVTGSTWSMKLSVPQPGEINTIAPLNEVEGQIRFTADGALSSYTPTNVNFTGNNGSSPNQNVNISLGTANSFDGVTSFDATSGTSGISQDGFPGGDLVGIRIDQSGTLVGSFSNGRSFGLAQIGMAKFTNNEGLVSDGSNVFLQSANSGDPIIGTAATAGRGFMQSSALEASNVDLSKSLTNLIIIQRGYQANGKTITTSDTLLETLLGIKR